MRNRVVRGGLSAVAATGIQRVAAPYLRGLGAVLMLHRVRPAAGRGGFAPNGKLEITPEFLDAALARMRRLGYRFLSLDEALGELRAGTATRRAPFVVLTFDDGYRDNVDHALPVLERHRAPFTIYVTTGLADRTARLWWVELEEVVRRSDALDVRAGDEHIRCRTASVADKERAFAALHRALQGVGDDRLLADVAEMGRPLGVDPQALLDAACLDWREIERVAAHPLATIGAHTLTHRRLTRLAEAEVEAEMAEAQREIERRLGQPVRHMAFPYGDATAARQREYAAARRVYDSAVTSCYGLITGATDVRAGIFPRVSMDGLRQDLGCLEVLLSGLPRAAKASLRGPRRAALGPRSPDRPGTGRVGDAAPAAGGPAATELGA